jgi:hypothetical protein
MKTHLTVLILCCLFAATLLNTARAEIPPLPDHELQRSAYIYRGKVAKIKWITRKQLRNGESPSCASVVKDAFVTLRLNQSHGKQAGTLIEVTGVTYDFGNGGCVGPTGNHGLSSLKVGDNAVIYGEKPSASTLIAIRQPNGLSVKK